VIRSFKHKGLKRLFTTGSTKGIHPDHARRLKLILFRLHSAKEVYDMDFPGSGLHQLKGRLKGCWAIKVTGNWRLIFRFEKGDAWEVNYNDYH
jgi:proteic killer suppression protein